MPRFSTAAHRMMSTTRWAPEDPAQRVTDTLWTSPAVTNSHLATTPDGDVVINTGFAYAGQRHRERYEEALGRPLEVRKIVFTQAYFEQIGGWSAFSGPGVETISYSLLVKSRKSVRGKSVSPFISNGLLIEHRYSIEGQSSPIPKDLLRLSIGIESVDDLVADLQQALA